jgi:single-strand DNA-binding protein
MGNLNRAILTGRLTADPEVRYTADEKPLAKFTIAVNRQKKGEADFVNCIAWSGLAKICGEYLKKGKPVALEGRLRLNKYEDKNGNKRTSTEVVVENLQMLDSKSNKAAPEADEIEIIEPSKPKKKKSE